MKKEHVYFFLCRIEREVKNMAKKGRPKGGKNRQWTVEEKSRIVKRNLEDKIGQHRVAREEGLSRGTLHRWITAYLEKGEAGLKNKKKTGNRFSALHTSKSLTEIERLQLIAAKQQIEIARLKNGYTVEGSGARKVFVTLSDANIKLFKD